MARESEQPESDRIFLALLAGVTGAGYGVILWVAAFFITEQSHSNIIGWSAAVFACFGFFYGNFAMEAFLALLHLIWGFLNGVTENEQAIRESGAQSHLRAFLLVGFCIGIVLAIWSYI